MNRQSKKRSTLALESLENRLVPAGWVLDPAMVDFSRVMIKFDMSQPVKLEANAYLAGVDVERTYDLTPGYFESVISSTVDYETTLNNLLTDPRVQRIDQNFRVSTQAIPNDPRYSQLWGMNNSGQTGGTAGADISAELAWDLGKGTGQTIIAVVDTGVDYNHPDLKANMWTNTGEVPGNGVDDDKNGYVDDYYGYDTANKDGDPMDDDSHGTHVAGTIGAVGNNNVGVVGVAWKTRIMAVKSLGTSGGSFADVVAGFDYAVANGAKIVNMSLGGRGGSPGDFAEVAIINAGKKGVILVAAAGNDGTNNDTSPFYPANYTAANIVSVAATDDKDGLAGFSNYGLESIDIGAPGVDIMSTLPNNSYGAQNGTSMAAPMVAGALVVMMDQSPGLTYQQYIAKLYKGADLIPSLAGKTTTGARLNLLKAMPSPQNIVFDPLASVTYGVSPITLNATGGGSGNPVTFSVISGPGQLIGNELRVDGAGDIVIETNQVGSNLYLNAVPVRQTLTVGQASLILAAVDSSRTYGATAPIYAYAASGFVNGDDLNDLFGLTCVTSALVDSGPGAYLLAPDATSPNYVISFQSAILTIFQAPLIVTAKSYGMSYGGTFPGSLDVTVTGLVLGEEQSVITGLGVFTTATPSSGAGIYFLFPTGFSPNYAINLKAGKLTISPRALSVSATNATRVFGEANPEFIVNVAGLVNGDTTADIQGLGAITNAIPRSPIGAYTILPTAVNPNYVITVIDAVLSVTPKDLIIAGGATTTTYGTAVPQLPYSVSGLVSPDTTDIIDNLGAGTPANALSNIGLYPIIVSGNSTDTNYNVVLRDGTLRVNPALLTFAALAAEKVYGSGLPNFVVDVSGWVNNDDPSQVSGVYADTSATGSSPVGIYRLFAHGQSTNPNYAPVLVDTSFVIIKAPLFVSAGNVNKVYGQGNPIYTPTDVQGLVNDDTLSNLGYWCTTKATVFSPVGTYPLTPFIGNGNYQTTYSEGTLTIEKAPLEIRSKNETRGYGQANPAFETIVSGLTSWDTLAKIKGLGASTVATKTSPVGQYSIVPTGASPNYQISYVSGELDVTEATLTIFALPQARFFGDPNPVFGTLVTGLVNGDKPTDIANLGATSLATSFSNVGSYAITPTGDLANYIINRVNSELVINRAPLVIAADDKTAIRKVDSMPTLTWQGIGFKNGEGTSVLQGYPELFTAASPSSAIGTYPITINLNAMISTNYTLVPKAGTFTVAPITQTVIPVGVVPLIVSLVGSGTGIQVFGPDGKKLANLNPYPGYHGSILTTTADLDGDGVMDIITAPGVGMASTIKAYSGRTLGQLANFTAYAKGFIGGVSLSAADLDGDGIAEILTGTGPGSAPHVKAFKPSGQIVASFYAYDPKFTRGVNLSVADLDGDGNREIVTYPNAGGGPNVKVFNGQGVKQASFFAYAPNYTGGMSLTTGDTNGDGKAEIITVGGPGASSVLRVFDKAGNKQKEWTPNNAFSGATRVLVADLDGNGTGEIITAMGAPGGPMIKSFSGTGQLTGQVFAFGFGYAGGLNIAAVTAKSGIGWDIVAAPAGPGSKSEVKRFATSRLALVDALFVANPGFNLGISLG